MNDFVKKFHFLFLFIVALPYQVSSDQSSGLTNAQLLKMGEQIYLHGVMADKSPVKAIIADDVTVTGAEFACVKCHQRSGLGTTEGSAISWRITGKELFKPRRRTGAWSLEHASTKTNNRSHTLPESFNSGDSRQAYTDITLADAIRSGVNPIGNKLTH